MSASGMHCEPVGGSRVWYDPAEPRSPGRVLPLCWVYREDASKLATAWAETGQATEKPTRMSNPKEPRR